MIASMTLQSKILRTKKRLSEDSWQSHIRVVAIIGLIGICAILLRATYIASAYGVVESEIPAVAVPVADPDDKAYKESPRAFINNKTPLVVLTAENFYFGHLESFSSGYSKVRNKFYVQHKNGAPNVAGLLKTMTKWIHQKTSTGNFSNNGIVILLPDKNIPAPIVIQTISYLKTSDNFNQVILAGGMI